MNSSWGQHEQDGQDFVLPAESLGTLPAERPTTAEAIRAELAQLFGPGRRYSKPRDAKVPTHALLTAEGTLRLVSDARGDLRDSIGPVNGESGRDPMPGIEDLVMHFAVDYDDERPLNVIANQLAAVLDPEGGPGHYRGSVAFADYAMTGISEDQWEELQLHYAEALKVLPRGKHGRRTAHPTPTAPTRSPWQPDDDETRVLTYALLTGDGALGMVSSSLGQLWALIDPAYKNRSYQDEMPSVPDLAMYFSLEGTEDQRPLNLVANQLVAVLDPAGGFGRYRGTVAFLNRHLTGISPEQWEELQAHHEPALTAVRQWQREQKARPVKSS